MIRVEQVAQSWALVGDGADVELAGEFVRDLLVTGRSTYTQRAYAVGLALFLRWLRQEGISLLEVTRATIVQYVRSLVESPRPLSAASVNHRLSLLSSFFAWRAARHDQGDYPITDRSNPVPGPTDRPVHMAAGRDAPHRERAELRRRLPVRVPRALDADTAARLVAAAPALRDKAILTLLWRTGARIGDWISDGDRHGVLGLAVDDVDRRGRLIRVRLKGARDEHRIPVTDDFWELWDNYLTLERGDPGGPWAWVGRRRGRGRPLRYDAFAAMLHSIAEETGVRVHAHMFRHGLAEAIVAVSGLHVAQEVLGHQHLATTAAFYARVDQAAMVTAVEQAARTAQAAATGDWVFPYDELTLEELGRLTSGHTEVTGR